MTRRLVLAAAVAVLFCVAGCSTGADRTPTPTETDLRVTVANDGNRSFTAEVLLFSERLTRLNVVSADGVSRPVTNLSTVPGVYAFAARNVTDVRLPPGVEPGSSSRFRLEPGDSAETGLFVPSGDATLLVVVRRDGRVAAWATVYCGPGSTLGRVGVAASAGDLGRFTDVSLDCAGR